MFFLFEKMQVMYEFILTPTCMEPTTCLNSCCIAGLVSSLRTFISPGDIVTVAEQPGDVLLSILPTYW
jgi:hypothetical protein